MKVRTVITYILGIIALSSVCLASGIRQIPNWWEVAKPFFAVFYICVTIALLINNLNYIRRITYPTLVCFCSWLYQHGLIKTTFTRNTYRLYKVNSRSFRKLFTYVQDLFDVMYM